MEQKQTADARVRARARSKEEEEEEEEVENKKSDAVGGDVAVAVEVDEGDVMMMEGTDPTPIRVPARVGDLEEDGDDGNDEGCGMRPAFHVSGEPSLDSGPPTTAEEYLRRVRYASVLSRVATAFVYLYCAYSGLLVL